MSASITAAAPAVGVLYKAGALITNNLEECKPHLNRAFCFRALVDKNEISVMSNDFKSESYLKIRYENHLKVKFSISIYIFLFIHLFIFVMIRYRE